MPTPGPRASAFTAVPLLLVAVVLAGCHGPGRALLTGTATETWTRTYTVSPDVAVEISNLNGPIEIDGSDGTTVEVQAEKIARAATEEGARDLLPRITIDEVTTPDRVSLTTRGIEGMLIGAAYEVRYQIRVPRTASVRARVTNGALTVRRVEGPVALTGTNGPVVAESLGGGLEARGVNGRMTISLAAIGDALVEVRNTNGGVDLSLPADARASLLATVTNGTIDTTDIALEAVGEQSRRRVRGLLNGGGTSVEVATVNGSIRITTNP